MFNHPSPRCGHTKVQRGDARCCQCALAVCEVGAGTAEVAESSLGFLRLVPAAVASPGSADELVGLELQIARHRFAPVEEGTAYTSGVSTGRLEAMVSKELVVSALAPTNSVVAAARLAQLSVRWDTDRLDVLKVVGVEVFKTIVPAPPHARRRARRAPAEDEPNWGNALCPRQPRRPQANPQARRSRANQQAGNARDLRASGEIVAPLSAAGAHEQHDARAGDDTDTFAFEDVLEEIISHDAGSGQAETIGDLRGGGTGHTDPSAVPSSVDDRHGGHDMGDDSPLSSVSSLSECISDVSCSSSVSSGSVSDDSDEAAPAAEASRASGACSSSSSRTPPGHLPDTSRTSEGSRRAIDESTAFAPRRPLGAQTPQECTGVHRRAPCVRHGS